eukprot:UN02419
MDHMPNLPIDVNEWSSRDVRIWLKAKGCDYSVQNKFFSERVDGEALLLLNTNDIHKLLYSYPLGYKVKISSYVDQLRQRRYVPNNNSNQQTPHHAKPKSIIITSPSILPCTDNMSFTDNNSDAQNTEKRNKRANNASTIAMLENDDDNESHDGNANINKGKKNNYKRYTNDVKHSTRNQGKRWIEYDLDLMWSLHQKGCSNMKIAEHFKRTECGVMVQIDKKYKDLRANEKMKEIVELRRKNIRRFYKNRKETQSSSESQSESDSDSDDDEPVINNIRRNKQNKEMPTNNLSDNNANQ